MLSHLPGYSLPERLWRTARRWALAWGRIVYLGAVILVLVLSPSSYTRSARHTLARQIYLDTAPILMGFTVLAALLALVITRIVVVTALSYGLSRYALEMVIRVLVLELIPLTATLFVAMRCTIPHGTQLALLRQSGHFDALRAQGGDPVRMELLPRVVAGVFASITLVWCLRSKHQIIAFAARATDAKIVSALLCQTNGFGSWLWRSMYCRMACSNSPMLVWALRLIHLSLI